MIFSTLIGLLLISYCFALDIPGISSEDSISDKLSSSAIAEAFHQAMKSSPTFEPLFDPTLSVDDYYHATSQQLGKLGVKDHRKLAKKVQQVISTTFPKLTPDKMKKSIIETMANFLTTQGAINPENMGKLVTSYGSFLQKALAESHGSRKLLASKGVEHGLGFLASSGALNKDNASEFFEKLFDSFYSSAYCQNSN